MRPDVPVMPGAAMPTASEAGDPASSSSSQPPVPLGFGNVDRDFAPQIRGYDVTGRLGHGGMGIVWRATQKSTRRPVALKLLGSSLFATPQARARFEREVQLTAKLEHPHVARVYESGVAEGVYFYAMELVEGVPLDSHVADRRHSRRQVLELMRLVCDAVQHAHQRGVIHRDLKPSNILVTADGQPKVLDFGLAKALESEPADGSGNGGEPVSAEGNVAGTPGFMSPEQSAGKPVDTRSDVYSLGVILYRLLTGRDPHGMTKWDPQSLHRVACEDVVRPRTADRSIDRDLEALLLKALARNPDDRYSSASGLARDLANYLAGDPLTAKRPTLTYFARKRLRKHWLPAVIALAVLAILVGQAIWSYRKLRTERNVNLSGKLAAQSVIQLMNKRLDLAHLLGIEAARAADTPEARHALVTGLENSPRLRRFLHGGPGDVSALALTRDGALLASAMRPPGERILSHWAPPGRFDYQVLLWDATGRLVGRLPAHAGPVLWLAFSADSNVLASAGADGLVRLWDVENLKPLGAPLVGHAGPVHTLAFSRDGTLLASGGVGGVDEDGQCNVGEIRVWDVRDGRRPQLKLIRRAHTTAVHALAFDRDGRRLASGSGGSVMFFNEIEEDYSVEVWDAATGARLTKSLAAPKVKQLRYGVTALRFHPTNPKYLVSASENGLLLVWDWAAGKISPDPSLGQKSLPGFEKQAVAALAPAGLGIAVRDILFVPTTDGDWRLLSAFADGTIAALEWWPDGYLTVAAEATDDKLIDQSQSLGPVVSSRDGAVWAAGLDGRSSGKIALGQVDAPADSGLLPSLDTPALMDRAGRRANRALTPEERATYLTTGG